MVGGSLCKYVRVCTDRGVGRVFRKSFSFAWDIFASDVLNILLFVSWFTWGCLSLSETRSLGHKQMSALQAAAEDSVGFGQLGPLVLLLLPLLELLDSYAQHRGDKRRRHGEYEELPLP
jgi:hypothetical protein